jgi:CheY-like chemotaxis protein
LTTRRPGTVSGSDDPRPSSLPPTVLVAEPDVGARAALKDALLEGAQPCDVRTVATGAELLAYLHRTHDHAPPAIAPAPAVILLELDLPDRDGLDVVRAIRSTKGSLPVVALTRRADPVTVAAAYEAGVNTLLPKPVTFLALVKLAKAFTAYWLELAALPRPEAAA